MVPVVAVVISKKGREPELEAMLRSLVMPTRREAGCLQYDLFVDKEHPGVYVFIERWDSDAALDAHLKSAHIAAGMARKEDLIERLDIRRLKHL